MYKKLKDKLNKLLKKKSDKKECEAILKKFEERIVKLKDKNDTDSQDEIAIIKHLIKKIKNINVTQQ